MYAVKVRKGDDARHGRTLHRQPAVPNAADRPRSYTLRVVVTAIKAQFYVGNDQLVTAGEQDGRAHGTASRACASITI